MVSAAIAGAAGRRSTRALGVQMFDYLRRILRRDESVGSEPGYLDAVDKVDIVSVDDAETVATLWLIVNYPWTTDATYVKLNEKLNHYVWFAIDGQMIREYPELEGKRCRLCIESMYPLTSRIVDMLPTVRSLLLARKIELKVMVADDKNRALVEFIVAS